MESPAGAGLSVTTYCEEATAYIMPSMPPPAETFKHSDPNGTYLSTNIFEHYPQPIENNKRELTGW